MLYCRLNIFLRIQSGWYPASSTSMPPGCWAPVNNEFKFCIISFSFQVGQEGIVLGLVTRCSSYWRCFHWHPKNWWDIWCLGRTQRDSKIAGENTLFGRLDVLSHSRARGENNSSDWNSIRNRENGFAGSCPCNTWVHLRSPSSFLCDVSFRTQFIHWLSGLNRHPPFQSYGKEFRAGEKPHSSLYKDFPVRRGLTVVSAHVCYFCLSSNIFITSTKISEDVEFPLLFNVTGPYLNH